MSLTYTCPLCQEKWTVTSDCCSRCPQCGKVEVDYTPAAIHVTMFAQDGILPSVERPEVMSDMEDRERAEKWCAAYGRAIETADALAQELNEVKAETAKTITADSKRIEEITQQLTQQLVDAMRGRQSSCTCEPMALCGAEHHTGARCRLKVGHTEAHFGEGPHCTAQWPRTEEELRRAIDINTLEARMARRSAFDGLNTLEEKVDALLRFAMHTDPAGVAFRAFVESRTKRVEQEP